MLHSSGIRVEQNRQLLFCCWSVDLSDSQKCLFHAIEIRIWKWRCHFVNCYYTNESLLIVLAAESWSIHSRRIIFDNCTLNLQGIFYLFFSIFLLTLIFFSDNALYCFNDSANLLASVNLNTNWHQHIWNNYFSRCKSFESPATNHNFPVLSDVCPSIRE